VLLRALIFAVSAVSPAETVLTSFVGPLAEVVMGVVGYDHGAERSDWRMSNEAGSSSTVGLNCETNCRPLEVQTQAVENRCCWCCRSRRSRWTSDVCRCDSHGLDGRAWRDGGRRFQIDTQLDITWPSLRRGPPAKNAYSFSPLAPLASV
jgi:hypothetical protein